tara:strand:+ start:513 stop:1811 length:1299 start_codon:yes stop_codon:yes gene_type:complete
MIEILNIILTVTIFLIISIFSNFLFYSRFRNQNNLDIIDISGKNFIIFLNIILISSIFNPDKEILFFLCFFISILSLYFFLKKIGRFKNKILYSFLFFLVFIIAIDISNNFGYTWDTKKYYLHKATAFYQNFFIDDFVKKAEYPHFGSYIWSFFWKNNLLNFEYTGRLVFGYIYVLSVFYFINSFKFSDYIKILISILLILATYETLLFDGRPDILVFSFFLFISKYLFEIFHKNQFDYPNIILIILTLNLILWTKSEGIAYVLLIASTLILFVKNNLNKKIFLIGLVLIIISLKYFTYYYYDISLNPHEDTFNLRLIKEIDLNYIATRSSQIVSWYFVYFFTNPIIILSSLSLLIILIRYKSLLSKFNYLYFFLLAKFCVLYATFFVTVYPMPFHVKYSLDRIIFHSSGLFLVIIYFFVINFLKDKKNFTY